MKKYLLLFLAGIFIYFFYPVIQTEASEGIIEMKNVNGSKARCFAMSTQTNRSSSFQIQIECRNLIYPIEPTGTYYVLWAIPVAKDSKPFVLGDIGFGKSSFYTQTVFGSLFITKEITQSPSEASKNQVMEGKVGAIPFLATEPSPTIKPSPTTKPTPAKKPTPKVTQKITPTPQSGRIGATTAILGTLFIIILIIVTAVIIFFIISRIRRSVQER